MKKFIAWVKSWFEPIPEFVEKNIIENKDFDFKQREVYTYQITYTPTDPNNKWTKVIHFFNTRDGIISRRAFLSTMLGHDAPFPKQTIYEQYCCYLREAGYVERLGPGRYERKKQIPWDLTTKKCRKEAYG